MDLNGSDSKALAERLMQIERRSEMGHMRKSIARLRMSVLGAVPDLGGPKPQSESRLGDTSEADRGPLASSLLGSP